MQFDVYITNKLFYSMPVNVLECTDLQSIKTADKAKVTSLVVTFTCCWIPNHKQRSYFISDRDQMV